MDQIIRRRPQPAPESRDGRILRCAFTGYRPQGLPFGFNEEDFRCVDFKQRIRYAVEYLVRHGYSHFLAGGALGFDTYAAEAVMGIRGKYPWVTLEIAVPFDAQAERWAPSSRFRYEWNLDQADIVTRVSREYAQDCMAKRNRYMVDQCDLLLAAYDGRPGGTMHTVNYARSQGKEIRLIPPVISETRMWIWDLDRDQPPGGDGPEHARENQTTA